LQVVSQAGGFWKLWGGCQHRYQVPKNQRDLELTLPRLAAPTNAESTDFGLSRPHLNAFATFLLRDYLDVIHMITR